MRKKIAACLACAMVLTIGFIDSIFAVQDSDVSYVNGIRCESVLGGGYPYVQATSEASSSSIQVGLIAMWGQLKVGTATANFSSSDCVRSSDHAAHQRIHLCASCISWNVANANSTHYYGNQSFRLSVTM